MELNFYQIADNKHDFVVLSGVILAVFNNAILTA